MIVHNKPFLAGIISLLLWLIPEQGQAAVTLSHDSSAVVCGNDVILRCTFTGSLILGVSRLWRKDGVNIVVNGVSTDPAKHLEDISNAASQYFELTIKKIESGDSGNYTCKNGFFEDQVTVSNCTKPTPPECEEKCCLILLIICGICAGITVVMWVICCWLQYKKEECCQIWCCIWLIVHGFFAVIAWILWGISYWQRKEDCCHCCQKAGFIVPIVLGFCAAVAGIIWGIFCCLQYKGIIHCIPPCCGLCVCIDCEEKKEEPDFIEYAKQELQWMDQKIADIKQKVSGGTDAAGKLNKAEQGRLDTCENRCKEEEEKLSKDTTNSYGGMIRDYIKKLRVKMPEVKKLQPEGNTLV